TDRMLRHAEVGRRQSALERSVRILRPDSDDTARRKRGVRARECPRAVEWIVATLGGAVRALIEIEQNQIEGTIGHTGDQVSDVADLYLYTRISDRFVGRWTERPATPVDDDGIELGHRDLRSERSAIEECPQRETHSEPADEYAIRRPIAK